MTWRRAAGIAGIARTGAVLFLVFGVGLAIAVLGLLASGVD